MNQAKRDVKPVKNTKQKEHKPRQKDAIEFSSIGDYMKYLEEQQKNEARGS